MFLTTTFVTSALKWFRLKFFRFELLLLGPRGVPPSVIILPSVASMRITLAIGSHLSCHVRGMRLPIRTSRRPTRGLGCMCFHLYVLDCYWLCGCAMNLPRWSRLGVLQQQLLMFSANRSCAISVECFLNFMLRYCCDKIAVAGGNVERVFSMSSASVTVSPHSRN